MKKLLFVLACFLALAPPSVGLAKSKSFKLAFDVPPRQYKTARLRNLVQGAALSVDIKTDNPVTVSLMSEKEIKKYPAVERPLFQGEVRDKISFAVRIPKTVTYYLVFLNRSSSQEAKVTFYVRGSYEPVMDPVQDKASKEKREQLEKKLTQIVQQLNKVLVFDPFPITVEVCGNGRAFSGPNGIGICMEFIKDVYGVTKDKEKSVNVLIFAVFHEIGHNLLSQWDYPFHDNEEAADEFAAVLMTVLGQQERLNNVVEYFVARSSSDELQAHAVHDDRHPLSIQRARNILRWSKDPELIKKWQTVLIPHMQKAALEKINRKTPSRAERDLAGKEPARRVSENR